MTTPVHRLLDSDRPMPMLFYPAAALLSKSVAQILSTARAQADAMGEIAKRFAPSAIFGPMDLSSEARAFGASALFPENSAPYVNVPFLATPSEADKLRPPDVKNSPIKKYVDAAKIFMDEYPDIPFAASVCAPLTTTAQLVGFSNAEEFITKNPSAARKISVAATEMLMQTLQAFKDAGAKGAIIAEPSAGTLNPSFHMQYSVEPLQRVVRELQTKDFAVICHYCGTNTQDLSAEFPQIGAAAYHFGNAVNMESASEYLSDDTVVLGNIDPISRFCAASADTVRKEAAALLKRGVGKRRFILSSGCDIPVTAKIENIEAFFEAYDTFKSDKGA